MVTRLLSDPAAQELAAQLAGLASQVAQVAVPKPDTDRNHHENDTSSEANWLHGCCLILRPRNWLHNLLSLASQVAQAAVPKPNTDRNHHENDTSSEAQWLHGCCLILRPRNWLHNLLVLLHRWLRRRFQSLTQTEITMKTTQVLKLTGYTAAV